MNKMNKKFKLKVCASCSWMYKSEGECPMCGFAYYGARYVYGNACYKNFKTQSPWKEEKLFDYEMKLNQIIRDKSEYEEKKKDMLTFRKYGYREE